MNMIVRAENIIKATRTQEVSPSIDSLTTQATLGTLAQNVNESELAPAASKGYLVLDTAQGIDSYIGQYAMTPQQLETAGVIKPGSSNLVKSLLASGVDVQKAMPPSIFTGKSGAKDYNSFVRNIPAQSEAMVKNLQVAQSSLQNAGLITGAEAPSEINGVIMSAANNGVNKVLEVLSSNNKSNTTVLNKQPVGKLNQTIKDIESGNYAGKLSETGMGALDGINTALQALDKSATTNKSAATGKGLQANTFDAIKNSIPNLTPNVPNDLTVLQNLKKQQVDAASKVGQSNDISQQLQGAAGILDVANKISSGRTNAGSSLLKLAGIPEPSTVDAQINSGFPDFLQNPLAVTSLKDAALNTATGILASTAGGIASGLNNLPGSLGSVTSITDFTKGNIPVIPGTEQLQLGVKNISSDALNNIQSNALSLANSFLGSNLGSFKDIAVNGLVDAVSSKLPAGSASLLQNAIGSIASGGFGLKTPSAAVNTVPDRQTIQNELKAAMGDAGIPEPNYVGVDDKAAGKVEQTTKERKEFIVKQKELKEKYQKANNDFIIAYTAYAVAMNNLPQGSSVVSGLKSKYEAKAQERNQAKKKLDDLYKEYPEFAVRNVTDTTKNSVKT